MKVSGIDIESNINNIKVQIEADNTLSPSMRIAMDLLLLIVTLLCQRIGLNSHNSSIPPSSDKNRKKIQKATVLKNQVDKRGIKAQR